MLEIGNDHPSFEDLYQQDDGNPGSGQPLSPAGGRIPARTTGFADQPPATKTKKKGALDMKKAKKPSMLKEA